MKILTVIILVKMRFLPPKPKYQMIKRIKDVNVRQSMGFHATNYTLFTFNSKNFVEGLLSSLQISELSSIKHNLHGGNG